MRTPTTPVAAPVAPVSSSWSPGSDADFDGFLSRLVPKTRASVDKHVEACAAEDRPGYGPLWKRLAVLLGKLAPHAIEVSGAVLRFYITDGKYRRQVFALEEERDARINLYMPDVTALALQRGLVGKPKGLLYAIPANPTANLEMDTICADTKEIPDYCKGMLGWGRRALRVSMTTAEEESAVLVIESLCHLAAEAWANLPVVEATPTPGAPR